jgi:hypothetical protein
MFNLFGLTWNDFCYSDSGGNSCWNTFFFATVVIVFLILIIARVIFWLAGRQWPFWLYFTPEVMPTGLPVWRVIVILVGVALVMLIGAIRQGGTPHNP